MLRASLILLFSLMLTTFVSAQDETPPPPRPIAGVYAITETIKASSLFSMAGEMTITGTGPVYSASFTPAGTSAARPAVSIITEGNIGVSVTTSDEYCQPAMLIRQTDGSLFGAWLDIDDSPTTLAMEHYVPQAPTKDFVGKYDLVGGYVGGQQYKGVSTIAPRNGDNAYSLDTTANLDEMFPDEVPSRSRGIALASGSRLGYTYTFENVVACDVTLYTFEPDGSVSGRYDLGTANGQGAFTGTRKAG